MKHRLNMAMCLVDFNKLKHIIDIWINYGAGDFAIRSYIVDVFSSNDEYKKNLLSSVIGECFPQYLFLLKTITVFG